ncbi:MAG: sugar isomerase, partial [Aquirufa sp.]
MNLKDQISSQNSQLIESHDRKLAFLKSEVDVPKGLIQQLKDFQIAIPSWALGTGGTRFGRFSGGGEPRNLEEKIEDVGLIHQLNRSSNSISLHIPWDIPSDANAIKQLLKAHDLTIDSVNSNTFQDQKDQPFSYKFGSLS